MWVMGMHVHVWVGVCTCMVLYVLQAVWSVYRHVWGSGYVCCKQCVCARFSAHAPVSVWTSESGVDMPVHLVVSVGCVCVCVCSEHGGGKLCLPRSPATNKT